MRVAKNVTELIGNTPLLKINKFSQNANIFAKVEYLNPSHSIKDRAAFMIIKDALDRGLIDTNSEIFEPTSGNMGVALAMVCAVFGLKLTLTMPSSMSVERQQLLKAFGANLVLTEPSLGMQGAVDKAEELAKNSLNSFMPKQFENPLNPLAHEKTTAVEIWNALEGKVDIVVAGFGTGGTISGIAKSLKLKNKKIKIVAVEPLSSPLLTQGRAGSHKIQGIGANFVPLNLKRELIDEVIDVSNEDAIHAAIKLAKEEGVLAGISSGANVFAAALLANKDENRGKNIVTVLPDTGERYLSTKIFDE